MEYEYKKYFEQESLWKNSLTGYQNQVLNDILALLPDEIHSILDVGCGNGIIANNLPQEIEVTGIDISCTALKHLRRSRVLGTLERLPFRDKSFDCVMANDIIEHLPDEILLPCLKELVRVSKKFIVITLPFMENLPTNSLLCKHCGTVYHANLHKRSYSYTDIVQLFPPRTCSLQLFCLSGEKRIGSINPFDVFKPLFDPEFSGIIPICPNCGTSFNPENKDGKRSFLTEIVDGLNEKYWTQHQDIWQYRPDRSECITLWTTSAIPNNPRLNLIHPEDSHQIDNNIIDFSNPAFYLCRPFPKYSIFPAFFPDSATPEYCENGLKINTEKGTGIIYLTFPLNVNDGGELELIAEPTGGMNPEVFIYTLYETYSKIEPACLNPLENHYLYQIPDGNYLTGTGCIFRVEIKDDGVNLRSASLTSKHMPLTYGCSAPIKQGHNFIKLDEKSNKIPILFGYTTEFNGWIPIPRWATSLDSIDQIMHEIMTSTCDQNLIRQVLRESEYISKNKEIRINYLNELLNTTDRQRSDLEIKIGTLTDQLNTTERQRSDLEIKIGTLTDQLNTTERQRSDLEVKIASLNELLNTTERQRSDLEVKIASLNELLNTTERQRSDLEIKIASLNELLNTTERQRSDLEIKIVTLTDQLNTSDRQRSDLEIKIVTLTDQLNIFSSTLMNNLTGLMNLNLDLENKNILINTLNDNLSETVYQLHREKLKTELSAIKEEYLVNQLKRKKRK
jgi:SAM-dependent methyltransferase